MSLARTGEYSACCLSGGYTFANYGSIDYLSGSQIRKITAPAAN